MYLIQIVYTLIVMTLKCYFVSSFAHKFVWSTRICSRSMSMSFTFHQQSFPSVTALQWNQLEKLSECLIDWNQKVNLVSRKDIDEIIPNHIIPALSVSLCHKFSPGDKVIDIGTGGGLPGLPLAIIHSDVKFTLLDSNSKKMGVVEDIVRSLCLKNVHVVTSRAEEFTGKFDALLGRSVSAIPNFLSWSAHLLRKDAAKDSGLFYIKGGDFLDELAYAGITQYKMHPIKELVKSIPESDKMVLHIPSEQIFSFHNRNSKSRR